jgi:hypothetical protein
MATLVVLGLFLIASTVSASSRLAVEPCDADIEYFDSTQLTCVVCDGETPPNNKVPDTNSLDYLHRPTSCVCNAGYRMRVPDCGNNAVTVAPCDATTCELCPTGLAASFDRTRCMSCGGTSTYDATRLDCVCPGNEILVEHDIAGTWLDAKECVACVL